MLNHLQMLRDAGFIEVIAEDRTDQVGIHLHFFFFHLWVCYARYHVFLNLKQWFCCAQFLQVLQRELNAVETNKNEFVQDFSEVCVLHFLSFSFHLY